MTDDLLGYQKADGWVRMGRRPGPVMWSYGFMRVERVPDGWRAWDVLRVPVVRATYPTTIHKTLRAAKDHCQQIVDHGSLT